MFSAIFSGCASADALQPRDGTISPARGVCVGFTCRPFTRMFPSSINR